MGLAEIGLAAVMDMDDFDQGSKEYMDGTKEMDDHTEGVAGRLSDAFGMVGTAVLAFSGVILAVGIGALVAFGSAALTAGLQFDEAFDSIVINTGATGEVLEGLKDDFKEVFLSVPTDANTAATAISSLNQRLEISGATLQNVVKPLLEVTRLTGGSIKSNSEALSGVAQDWAIANEDLAITLDKVFVASQQTGANFGGLLQQMDQFGPILKSMGFSFEESISLMGGLEEAGVNVGSVMMGLRLASKKLAETGKPMNEAFAETIEKIKGATTEQEALTIASDIFGSRSGIELANAIRSGKLELEDLTNVLIGANGNIMQTSESTMDFGERWTMVKNKMSLALEPIGAELMGLLNTLVTSVTPGVEAFGKVFSETVAPAIKSAMPVITQFVGKVLSNLVKWLVDKLPAAVTTMENIWNTVLLPAFQWISNFWTGTLAPVFAQIHSWLAEKLPLAIAFVQAHSEEFKGALIALGAILAGAAIVGGITSIIGLLGALMNPIGLIIAAIALLGAAWAGNWFGIRDTITAVWENTIKPALEALWNWLGVVIPPIIDALSKWFTETLVPAAQTFANFVKTSVVPALQAIWSFISTKVIPIITTLANWFKDNLVTAVQALVNYWNTSLKPALQAVWSFISVNVLPIFRALGELIGVVVMAYVKEFSNLWNNTLKPALNTVWSFIQNNVIPVFRALSTKVSEVASAVRETLGPAINWFRNTVLGGLSSLIDGIKSSLQRLLDFINRVIEAIGRLRGSNIPNAGGLDGPAGTGNNPLSNGMGNQPLPSTNQNVVNLNMGGQNFYNGMDAGTLVALIDSRVKTALGV